MPSRLALICALFCFACGESTSATGDAPNKDGGTDAAPLPDGVFESDDPTSTKEIQPEPENTEEFGGDDGVNPGEWGAEFDSSTLEGNTLYTLSLFWGLSIIDVTVADEPKLLGRHKLNGRPFEMYVKDSVVLAVLEDGEVKKSRLVTLDVETPAAIQELAEIEIPGSVIDARLKNDVMYVISTSASGSETSVLAFDVSQPAQPAKLDELAVTAEVTSVLSTNDRVYLASADATDSEVSIVDITNPNGLLAPGASFGVEGSIADRGQMDETNGVFRVVTRPALDHVLRVETFTVTSSSSVTPLGELAVTIGDWDELKNVRFDGTRAYAVTYTSYNPTAYSYPLFAVDLGNPAAPKLLGELSIPGAVSHIEPRGNRLLSFGFDTSEPEGSLNVTLFDVSNMSNPSLLDRVAFGGEEGELVQKPNGMNETFDIVEQAGLLLIPYSGWSNGKYGCGVEHSGIQLVDFADDQLVSRGTAPIRRGARSALLHQNRLIAISEADVSSFDITDRDSPEAKGSVETSVYVSQTVQVGNKIARVGAPSFGTVATLDVTTLDAVTEMGPKLIEIPMQEKCAFDDWDDTHVFTSGMRVYLLRGASLAVVDLAADEPVLLGVITIPDPAPSAPEPPFDGYGSQFRPLLDPTRESVNVGSTIVLHRHYTTVVNGQYERRAWFIVVDASDPSSPTITPIERKASIGFNALSVAADRVASTRWEPSPTTPGKVRFYLDQLDLSDPKQPKLLAPINVPGSLQSIRDDATRLLSVDYERVEEKDVTSQECRDKWSLTEEFTAEYQSGSQWVGTCVGFTRRARLVELADDAALIDTTTLAPTLYDRDVVFGDDRVHYPMSFTPTEAYHSTILSGLGAEKVTLGEVEFPLAELGTSLLPTLTQTIAVGTHLYVVQSHPATLFPVDTANLAQIEVHDGLDLENGYVRDVAIMGDTAVCSLEHFGVSTFPLPN